MVEVDIISISKAQGGVLQEELSQIEHIEDRRQWGTLRGAVYNSIVQSNRLFQPDSDLLVSEKTINQLEKRQRLALFSHAGQQSLSQQGIKGSLDIYNNHCDFSAHGHSSLNIVGKRRYQVYYRPFRKSTSVLQAQNIVSKSCLGDPPCNNPFQTL